MLAGVEKFSRVRDILYLFISPRVHELCESLDESLLIQPLQIHSVRLESQPRNEEWVFSQDLENNSQAKCRSMSHIGN